MPTFTYRARDAQGLPAQGVATAGGPEALAAELRGRGLLVVQITPQIETGEEGPAEPLLDPRTWLPATRYDVELGLQQLATMIGSGLTLLTALRTASDQARRPRAARLWRRIAERIEGGDTLADALAVETRCFSNYVVQLARVGESSGELDSMMTRAAQHLEQARNLRLMLVNALMYPFLVLLMAVGVASFMVLNVIPKVQSFLVGSGRNLPPLTQNLLAISTWLRAYLPQLGIGLGVLILALMVLHRWPPGRLVMDRLLLRIPILGSVFRTIGTAVFARGLGVLLESGVGLLEGLYGVELLVGNAAQAHCIAEARGTVTQGGTLAAALGGHRAFPVMLSRMVAVGEATGTLGATLAGVATYHEAQVVASVRRLGVLVEPAMILVVGGIVGFVYTAFFVALFSLASTAGH